MDISMCTHTCTDLHMAHTQACAEALSSSPQFGAVVIEYISARSLCIRENTHTCAVSSQRQELVITSCFPYRDERNQAEDNKRGMGTD